MLQNSWIRWPEGSSISASCIGQAAAYSCPAVLCGLWNTHHPEHLCSLFFFPACWLLLSHPCCQTSHLHNCQHCSFCTNFSFPYLLGKALDLGLLHLFQPKLNWFLKHCCCALGFPNFKKVAEMMSTCFAPFSECITVSHLCLAWIVKADQFRLQVLTVLLSTTAFFFSHFNC